AGTLESDNNTNWRCASSISPTPASSSPTRVKTSCRSATRTLGELRVPAGHTQRDRALESSPQEGSGHGHRWECGSDELPLFVHMAAGVFIGLVAAVFVIWKVAEWQVGVAAAEMKAGLEHATRAAADEARRSREAAQQAEAAKRARAASAQQAAELAQRQA